MPKHLSRNLKQFENVLNGVVRVYCTHSRPNFAQPWQKKEQYSSTSSGFMIAGRVLVTNAHAVEYATLIQVHYLLCCMFVELCQSRLAGQEAHVGEKVHCSSDCHRYVNHRAPPSNTNDSGHAGHECDLALLSVEDENFWLDAKPLKFGDMPALQDSVCVVGYPIGGNSVSITAGMLKLIAHALIITK
jgi:S1-C subfamily serine protease